MYHYNARIINIVDGDTVDAEIDVGFKIKILHRLRLLHVDTEEMNSKDPQLRELAKAAKDYLVENLLDQSVTIRTQKSDSFGRYLAEIYINEVHLNEQLIDLKLARRWVK